MNVETLEFNVKFITPLLIGGAEKSGVKKSSVDRNGLSGKALRGCWRFWCRAIIGGIIKNINNKNVNFLESKIFGSADIEIGAKFRMNVKLLNSIAPESFPLGFIRNGKPMEKEGFPQGTSYSITIIPRKTMFEHEKNILFTTIWLWGNLGAVGNRERRGFGSPIIYLKDGSNNPFAFQNLDGTKIELPIKEQPFIDSKELKEHLKKGLESVWTIYKQWINANNVDTVEENIATLSAPIDAPYFILRSLKQIAVGNIGYMNGYDAIPAVHGKSNCDELGWAKGQNRMASPVFIRFHDAKRMGQVEYLPIFTWCKQKNIPDNNFARNYLVNNILSNQQKVFINTLDGTPL